jgi:hypothetical protein
VWIDNSFLCAGGKTMNNDKLGKTFNITAADLMNEYYEYRLCYEKMTKALMDLMADSQDETLKEKLMDLNIVTQNYSLFRKISNKTTSFNRR